VLIGAGCATGGNFLGDKEGVGPGITAKLRYKKNARKIERKAISFCSWQTVS